MDMVGQGVGEGQFALVGTTEEGSFVWDIYQHVADARVVENRQLIIVSVKRDWLAISVMLCLAAMLNLLLVVPVIKKLRNKK